MTVPSSARDNPLQQAMTRLEGHIVARLGRPPRLPEEANGQSATLSPAAPQAHPPAGLPSLFDSHYHPHRAYLESVPRRLPDGRRVLFRGQELRGDDLAVWTELLQQWVRRPSAEWVELNPRTLLPALGWGTSDHDRARLRECLERMQATTLRLPGATPAAGGVSQSLIARCEWRPAGSDSTGRWRVWIEPTVRVLFTEEKAAPAPGSGHPPAPLAQRIRRLYARYPQPYARKLDTLWRQCGLDGPRDTFRLRLTVALATLQRSGFLESYRIDERERVYVSRALKGAVPASDEASRERPSQRQIAQVP